MKIRFVLGLTFCFISSFIDCAVADRRQGHFQSSNIKTRSTITCSSVIDVGGLRNVLYKDQNVHGGRGRTFLDQDRRLHGARTLSIAGQNGKVIGCFGLYRCDWPFGCRYYQAMCHDMSSKTTFMKNAKKNGGITVLVGTGSGTCYSFPANASRYGSVRK